MAEIGVTQVGTYIELEGKAAAVTQLGLYAEIAKTELRATEIGIYIEFEGDTGLKAPTNLVATAIRASEAELTWDDSNPLWDNFVVERSPAGADTWVVVASPVGNFYTDTGLTPSTAYDYRVKTVLESEESPYSNIATTTLLSAPRRQALRLFVLAPEVVFKARVNQASFTYPLAQVDYDSVTVGNYGLLEMDLTILFGTTEGGDDLGRQRIRAEPTGSTIYFGRSSEGTGDGEVALEDNAYITVLNDRRIWAKVPYDTDTVPVVQYKDHNLAVGVYTTTPPPVANTGSPAAGTVDSLTGVLRVRLPQGTQLSYTVATGATIILYVWTLPPGVTLVDGYALSDPVIEVDCEPGFYWVGLAVVDSNNQVHEAWTWILAIDPAADVTTTGFAVRSHRRTVEGQTLEVELTQPLPQASYPDGTLVALIDGDPTASNDRTNVLFWGWHQFDPAEIRTERVGLIRRTRLTCVDVAGRLAGLPGFPQMVENEAVRDTTAHPAITWSHMVDFDLEKYIDYLLRWHSTALELTDYLPTGTAGTYAIGGALQSDGASLWDQVVGRVKAFTPAKNIGCNKRGQLLIRHNPMLENPASRTAVVQAALTAANWSDLRWTHQRPPRVHWLRGSAVQAMATLPTGADGPYQPTFFCIAPGFAPGQGETAETRGNLLSDTQVRLNDAMGHEYARRNARESLFDITLVGDQYQELDPAEMTWVTLTVDAAYAAQRGLSFTAARGLPVEVSYGYQARREGLVLSATLRWEKETVGRPALTIVQPDVPAAVEDDFIVPAPWTPPLPGDPSVWYGNPAGYILWDGAHVMRTWDILAASPVWELVDTGITGEVYDGQYVHVNANMVGMWLLTADGVWWCGDIMATTPSWSLKLATATVVATDVQLAGSASVIFAMMNYASEPGYLIVSTGPLSLSSTEGYNYLHSYTWHTHDYGATWTQIDMTEFTATSLGNIGCYSACGRYAIDIYKSAPVIWMVRSAPPLQSECAVFKSTDLGHTWTKEYWWDVTGGQIGFGASLLAPFPNITNPSFVNRGTTGGGTVNRPWLYVSTDAWATATQQPKVTDFDGLAFEMRVNSNTFAPNHVLAWWTKSDLTGVLFESADAGVTWAQLLESGITAGYVQTPNGWPPDTSVWFNVRRDGSTGVAAEVIQYTADKFATMQDKRGNLAALITNWTAGYNNGFALPRVGANI